jgi:hypothetical protein
VEGPSIPNSNHFETLVSHPSPGSQTSEAKSVLRQDLIRKKFETMQVCATQRQTEADFWRQANQQLTQDTLLCKANNVDLLIIGAYILPINPSFTQNSMLYINSLEIRWTGHGKNCVRLREPRHTLQRWTMLLPEHIFHAQYRPRMKPVVDISSLEKACCDMVTPMGTFGGLNSIIVILSSVRGEGRELTERNGPGQRLFASTRQCFLLTSLPRLTNSGM